MPTSRASSRCGAEEFVGNINNKGRNDANGTLTNYKDHGFGFALGMDVGSARGGWYGGALSFYSGDVSETLPRASQTHEQWYMLTGYSDWRGKHVFFDTTGSVGYGSFNGNRDLVVGDQNRDAVGKRAGLLGALGATGGVFMKYGLLDILPHVALDGLATREEGYTESGGGDGLDLQVAPYYANSLARLDRQRLQDPLQSCWAPPSRRKRGWAIATTSSTRR